MRTQAKTLPQDWQDSEKTTVIIGFPEQRLTKEDYPGGQPQSGKIYTVVYWEIAEFDCKQF